MSDSELLGRSRDRRPGASASGGWSYSGLLITGNTTQQGSLQAVFPDAGNYTIQFQVADANLPAGGTNQQATEALITWSVEGNSVTRRVSVMNGTSISGSGQGVRVVLSDVSITSVSASYLASMQVVRGVRPNTGMPAVYEPMTSVSTLAGGANATLAIDPSIGAIAAYTSVMCLNGGVGVVVPNNSVTVEQLDASGTTIRAYDPRDFEWAPLAPGARSLKITNHLAAANVVTYRHTLGIDG